MKLPAFFEDVTTDIMYSPSLCLPSHAQRHFFCDQARWYFGYALWLSSYALPIAAKAGQPIGNPVLVGVDRPWRKGSIVAATNNENARLS